MKQFLKPIELNATGYRISLLHHVLSAFGLSVSAAEVSAVKAGEDTLKQVRGLQAYLNVPVDESTHVNEVTAVTIAAGHRKMSLTTASLSFLVADADWRQKSVVEREDVVSEMMLAMVDQPATRMSNTWQRRKLS